MLQYCQGDILIERVTDAPVSGERLQASDDGNVVIAEGEFTGHRHAFVSGDVILYHDASLARDVQPALYIGHLKIEKPSARLEHNEHFAIDLPAGTYRVRRQREFDERAAWSMDFTGRVVSD